MTEFSSGTMLPAVCNHCNVGGYAHKPDCIIVACANSCSAEILQMLLSDYLKREGKRIGNSTPTPPHIHDKITPAYYGGDNNVHEPDAFIAAHGLNFRLGNVIKYITRAGKKSRASYVSDLHKALDYLKREYEHAVAAIPLPYWYTCHKCGSRFSTDIKCTGIAVCAICSCHI